ncbi:MAG: DUF2313 domain-containing protein [Deltaproteobacteria bacterium]|nr:DUF2313 domain-containing protein [Deltaproteobacteria bacterium]
MDVRHYTGLLRQLLPPGIIWECEPGSVMHRTLEGIAAELARVDGRVPDLLREMFPETSDELLLDFERVFGLPGPCITQEQTFAQRREAAWAADLADGGQSKAYLIEVAARLGFEITIETFPAGYEDPDEIGDPEWDAEWAHVWRVHGVGDLIRTANAGEACAGEPLTWADNEILPCLFARLAPAHTVLLFAPAEEDEEE